MIVIMHARNVGVIGPYRFVFLIHIGGKLYALYHLPRLVFHFLHRFITHVGLYHIFLALFNSFQLEAQKIRIPLFKVYYLGFLRADV